MFDYSQEDADRRYEDEDYFFDFETTDIEWDNTLLTEEDCEAG